MWVIIIALVFLFIFFRTCSTFIFQFLISLSTNIGFRPILTKHKIDEIIVNEGTITSSPFLKLSDLIAISKAAVPLETAIPYFLLLYFLHKIS